MGDALVAFEQEYAALNEVSHCIGVGSGYDALFIALKACGVGFGDEVIVPAHTYVATWLAVSNTGAKAIPVEPDSSTFCIDVNEIERHINAKTKVILPVHMYGLSCNMSALTEIGKRHNLFVIEDNAQAHGATWQGKKTGSFGQINATSFYPTKNLGALGDGGAITTNEEDLAGFVTRYRNYGFERKGVCSEFGVNSRLDELQASILSIKLKHLEQWNSQRRELAATYLERLNGVGDLQLPYCPEQAMHVYHLFVIRSAHRDKLQLYLRSHKIETMVHYPIPPHLQKIYSSDFRWGVFPITEKMAETVLSLPLWPGMSQDQVTYICDHIVQFYKTL